MLRCSPVFVLRAREASEEFQDEREIGITQRKRGGGFKTLEAADRDVRKERGEVNE